MIFNMATQSKRLVPFQDSIKMHTQQLQWLMFLFFRIFFHPLLTAPDPDLPLAQHFAGKPQRPQTPSPTALGKSVAIDRSWVLTLAHT